MSSKKSGSPEKKRNMKWIFVCIYFSASIVFSVCAVFIPGPRKILDIRLLYFFLCASFVFFIAFRFKKAFGLPFMFLFLLSVFSVLLFLKAVTAFTGETEIARVNVLSLNDGRMKLEMVLPDEQTRLLDMEGEYFAPVVKVIIFDDLLVFLGSKTWYRFVGMSSYKKEKGNEILIQADRVQLIEKTGISEGVYSFYEEYEKNIPGLKSPQIEVIQKKAKVLGIYSIKVQNDGGVEVILVNEGAKAS